MQILQNFAGHRTIYSPIPGNARSLLSGIVRIHILKYGLRAQEWDRLRYKLILSKVRQHYGTRRLGSLFVCISLLVT